MSKKRVIAVLVCIVMTVFVGVCFAGCDQDEPDETLEVIDPYGEYIKKDFDTKMREELIRPEGMSEEEFNVRISVEAVYIYKEHKDNHYVEDISNEPRYGIEKFDRYDGLIAFFDIDDLKEVISNRAFKKDYHNKFGVHPPDYLLAPSKVREEWIKAELLAVNDEYFYVIQGDDFNDDMGMVTQFVFGRQRGIDARVVAEMYAGLEGKALNKVHAGDYDVYYFSAGDDCKLFKVLRIFGASISTAYFWEQDGALGLVIIKGEHAKENLEYCKLIKYEF